MLLLAVPERPEKATSDVLARSVNTNPVVVRRITRRLARAGLVRVQRGRGGAALARTPAEISLADVWHATRSVPERPLLALPSQLGALGRDVCAALGAAFRAAEDAMEQSLARTTLDSLVRAMTELRPPATAA